MFTLSGFAFDWVIIWSLIFETIGCGIGCVILRSSGDYNDHNDGCGIATGVVYLLFSMIALGILGYWGYLPEHPLPWIWNERYGLLIYAGVYILTGFIASGIWFERWMRGRVTCFKFERQCFLRNKGLQSAGPETAVPSQYKDDWQALLRSQVRIAALGSLPPFATYRADLGRRIAWWPLYLTNWVICDLLTDLLGKFGQLMAWFAGLFRKLYEDLARRFLSEIAADAPQG
jgi:hypothetical protein